jgi:hypothetical protein
MTTIYKQFFSDYHPYKYGINIRPFGQFSTLIIRSQCDICRSRKLIIPSLYALGAANLETDSLRNVGC